MKDNYYEFDHSFLLHQPFFCDGVMNYKEFMSYEPYQALYYEFQTGGREQTQYHTYIPNGCVDLLFIQEAGGNHLELLKAGSEVQQIMLRPNASYFGIRFKPGIYLSDFESYDMTEADLYPSDCGASGISYRNGTEQKLIFCRELTLFFEKLSRTELLNGKAALFHSLLEPCLPLTQVNTLTGYMLSKINETQGNVRIHELAEELHYSERHLSRVFLDSMGISPKTFARIVRFQNAIDAIMNQTMHSLCDSIIELGYSDQAHFQREFKQYTGITPKRFLVYLQDAKLTLCNISSMSQKQAS